MLIVNVEMYMCQGDGLLAVGMNLKHIVKFDPSIEQAQITDLIDLSGLSL